MDRITYIRQEEKAYHEYCYENYKLFAEGSWLHRPVETVMDNMLYFENKDDVRILDLGCGVGRNTIPMAKKLKKTSGTVVAVDLLDSALTKLKEYGEEYDVYEQIKAIQQDIGDFTISPNTYDYVVAVSSLEHVQSEVVLDKVLEDIALGTKKNGITCIILNTGMEEINPENNEKLDALIEVNMPTDYMLDKMKRIFNGWAELKIIVKPLEYQIVRKGCPVLLKTNALTYVAQKQ